MEDETGAAATLSQLRALGIKVVLDNFGTGYSSLNYLRQYRVDKVKIDRSLVTQMTASSEGTTVVQAIISLARSLKKKGSRLRVSRARMRRLSSLSSAVMRF